MNALAKLPRAVSATVVQSIPYRTESPISAGKALSVFGVTIALLVVAVGVLLWARKRGWLQRWSMAAGDSKPSRSALRVLGQARLGHASHAYVIEADGSRFVVVESSRQVNLHPLPKESSMLGSGHE